MDLSSSENRIAAAAKIKDDINKYCQNLKEVRFSNRLNPSSLGEECTAQLWYNWRWATEPEIIDGRMTRYNWRGEQNEENISDWLRATGWTVTDKDENGEQLSVSDFDGHLFGKLDGEASHPFYTNNEKVLLEYKFINTKRFVALTSKALKVADEKYYGQIVLYMMYRNLNYCLWIPGNRNDDDIKPIFIPRDDGYAQEIIRKAETIISSNARPARIAESAAFYKCKFCNHVDVCHNQKPVAVNCRSCLNCVPIMNGKFYCNHWQAEIPNKEAMLAACGYHKPIQ